MTTIVSEEFTNWLRDAFKDVSFSGKRASGKYKHSGKTFQRGELFQAVINEYRTRGSREKDFEADNNVLCLLDDSPEATNILSTLDSIATENKKAHGRSEKERRDAGVGGSMEDEVKKIREAPMRINSVDRQIFDRFRTVRHNTVRMLYFVKREADGDGAVRERLVCLGVISDNQGARSSLADQMAECANLDIAQYYIDAANNLSNKYNELQAMSESDYAKYLSETKEDQWPEIRALKYKTLDSLMEAYIAHTANKGLPALPWTLGNVDLYKITSSVIDDSKADGKGKISWLSGFKFIPRQGILLDAKNYYLWALNQSQYFANIKRPQQFGDIYRLKRKPDGEVVDWESNPILRAYFASQTEDQRKCSSAFWYCVATGRPTPNMCDMNRGGTLKNKVAMLVRKYCSELWECPQENVMFKIQGDQLADDKNLVQGDGTVVRPYLDYLFVFYDEFLPSKEMWNNFKAIFGAYEPVVNVKQMYVDRYPVTGKPVPMYMTKNSYVQFYDKGALWRRLFIIRTDAHNSYRKLLSDEERILLDDEKTCRDAFATLMAMGCKAHKEIVAKGGMDDINTIFPEIGKVFNSYADDFDRDVKDFYRSMFDGKAEDVIVRKTKDVIEGFRKFTDCDDDSPSLSSRLIPNLLNMHKDNCKTRVREAGKQTTRYKFHRISDDVVSTEEGI